MKSDNIIQQKSFAFAIGVVNYKFLISEKKEFVLSKQLLRSGTSRGANIEESIGGGKDFLSKISISYERSKRNHLLAEITSSNRFLVRK
jgi:four helix bundle protein